MGNDVTNQLNQKSVLGATRTYAISNDNNGEYAEVTVTAGGVPGVYCV